MVYYNTIIGIWDVFFYRTEALRLAVAKAVTAAEPDAEIISNN